MESSSKVTVTYWDPSSLFPLIESDIRQHLPLRNLNWQRGSGRPLRSIDQLHVELVPYTGDSGGVPVVPVRKPSVTGEEPYPPPPPGGKRRRHQIPGLRNTPYLKLYILRCDDNDTYKSTSRRLLREWVNTHGAVSGPTPASTTSSSASLAPTSSLGGGGSSTSLSSASGSGGGKDGVKDGGSGGGKHHHVHVPTLTASHQHDAAEWLIIHIILPGTAAYAQPRAHAPATAGTAGTGGSVQARGWAGIKGSATTLLEKIRSDFNIAGSSKSGSGGGSGPIGSGGSGSGGGSGGIRDKVVQLRIHPNHPALPMLSPPVPIAPYTLWSSPPEPKEEMEASYQELVAKMKSHILASFDTRVARYEEDVRERDAQRRLPGWNFCTFFVLKEGLARAFESVGLVEDALVLYDELAVGLQEYLRDGGSGGVGVLGIEDWTEETRGWIFKAQDRLRRKMRAVQQGKARGAGNTTPTPTPPPPPNITLAPGLRIGTNVRDEDGETTVVGDASDIGESGDTTAHETDSEYNNGHDADTSDNSDDTDRGPHLPASISSLPPPHLSPYRKPYRDLILSNRISVFDFECYLFARQSNLLLRLGGAHNSVVPTPTLPSHPPTAIGGWTTAAGGDHHPFSPYHQISGSGASGASQEEDLKHLTNLLRRALAFVTTVGRILRSDLYKGWQAAYPSPETTGEREWGKGLDEDVVRTEKERILRESVDDVVANWMFSVCMQLLEQTEAKAIPRDVLWGVGSTVTTPHAPSGVMSGVSTGTGAFPRRTSSLPGTPNIEQTTFGQAISGGGGYRENRPASIMVAGGHGIAQGPSTAQNNPGLEELCAARGDLLVLARSLVEGFARRKGWLGEWGSEGRGGRRRRRGWFEKVKTPGLEDVDLNDDTAGEREEEEEKEEEKGERKEGFYVGCGVTNRTLKKAVESEMGFYELFEELSEKARRHFTLGKKNKSAERVIADLAALKFHLHDYRMAAHYLEKLTTFYSNDGWGLIETSLLTMYARCLKKMGRKEDYIRTLLRLLKKAAAKRMRWDWRRVAGISSVVSHTSSGVGDVEMEEDAPAEEAGTIVNDDEYLDVSGYVSEIIALSDKISQNITSPMTSYWTDILVDPYPRHLDHKRDGFKILVKFHYLLDESMPVQAVKVRIVSMLGGPSSREIWLSTPPPTPNSPALTIKRGTQRIWLETTHNIPGTYIVDQILVTANNVSFVHEILVKTTPATPVALTASNAAAAINAAKRSRLNLWPARDSLSVHLRLPAKVHLDRGRKVEIVICTGWNHVLRGDVVVKSATAGLRMMMREVELVSPPPQTTNMGIVRLEGGRIHLAGIPERAKLVLRIPYSTERGELAELAVKIEIQYTTPTGEYVYAGGGTVGVALPLAVNVQDVFKGGKPGDMSRGVLFSKFQVSTALDIPLWVEGVRLDGVEGYVVESASGPEGAASAGGEGGGVGWLVVPRQPGQFVYRIRKGAMTATGGLPGLVSKRTMLQLEIKYRRLDEQLLSSLLRAFVSAIQNRGSAEEGDNSAQVSTSTPPPNIGRYLPLLTAHIRSRILSTSPTSITTSTSTIPVPTVPMSAYELAGIRGEIISPSIIPPYDAFGWDEVIRECIPLSGGEREIVSKWVREWWEEVLSKKGVPLWNSSSTCGIDQEEEISAEVEARSLVIPVEVPRVDVVCTTEIRLLDVNDKFIIAGRSVKAEVVIRWSRAWAGLMPPQPPSAGLSSSSSSSQQGVLTDFYYHIIQPSSPHHHLPASTSTAATGGGITSPSGATASTPHLHPVADTWLIAGRKRGGFTIPPPTAATSDNSDEEQGQELRVPITLVPLRHGTVTFPAVEVKPMPGADGQVGQSSGVVVEVECVSAGETVTVVKDVRSVCVGIGGVAGGEGEGEVGAVGEEAGAGGIGGMGGVGMGVVGHARRGSVMV